MRVAAIALAAALLLAGCATARPQPNAREGLLERLDGLAEAPPSRGGTAGGDGDASAVREAGADALPGSVRREIRWPLRKVEVTSPFGRRGRDFHEGVDLRAPVGTPVFAAHGGRVLYAGSRIRGYGRMIVLKHPSGVATVYAHNSRLFVRPGVAVRTGQRIALSGRTGRARGPHVHFEVRRDSLVFDPSRIIQRAQAAPTRQAQAPPAPRPPNRRVASRRQQ